MRKCEIYVPNDRDISDEVAGAVQLDNGHLTVTSTPGNEALMDGVLNRYMLDTDGYTKIYPSNAGAWFNALSGQYHGTRVWARIVRNTTRPKAGCIVDATDDNHGGAFILTGQKNH